MKCIEKETKKNLREPFFIVPDRVFGLGLTPYELSVLLYLMMRSDNQTHSCFPSAHGIAENCSMSIRKVRDVISSLESKKIISIKANYTQTHKNFNRQTSNYYTVNIYNDNSAQNALPQCTKYTPPEQSVHTPPAPGAGEINKTISNITKNNLSISTELTAEAVADEESDKFSFFELKRDCFETLKNERGFDEDDITLLERALMQLWFKDRDEYQGEKYGQKELRALMMNKTTADILAAAVVFLRAAGASVRSPVAYLSKCILGGLVTDGLSYKAKMKSEAAHSVGRSAPKEINDGADGQSSFDLDDFFSAALCKTYGNDFKF